MMIGSSLLKKPLLTSFRRSWLMEMNPLQLSFYPPECLYQFLDFVCAATRQKKTDALPIF